jgi:Coenzyme PQQ synthesis protein D (PqqD)
VTTRAEAVVLVTTAGTDRLPDAEVGAVHLREDDLVMREVGGKTMVLDLASSTYFAVGGVGTVVLDALRHGDMTQNELVEQLLKRFAVDRPRLETDISAFLDRLSDAGLLVR